MVYGEYSFLLPTDGRFFRYASDMQNRELQILIAIFEGNQEYVLELMSVPMRAARDAESALEYARKTLEVIATDNQTNAAFKEQVRQSAEHKIQMLSSPSEGE